MFLFFFFFLLVYSSVRVWLKKKKNSSDLEKQKKNLSRRHCQGTQPITNVVLLLNGKLIKFLELSLLRVEKGISPWILFYMMIKIKKVCRLHCLPRHRPQTLPNPHIYLFNAKTYNKYLILFLKLILQSKSAFIFTSYRK